jgi:ParB family transcriptional regulator, chromosome partitioning protein
MMKINPFVQTYQDVLISAITIPDDHRDLDEVKAALLANSIQETGLLQPVGLTRDYRLVYGRHRLAAYEKLGYTSIPAIIRDYETDLLFELATLDENLQRNGLTALEEDRALARRKVIFETLHPETKAVTKRGGPGRGKKTNDKMSHVSFTEDTAAKTGNTRRTIERKVEIGEKLDPQAAAMLKGTPIEDNQSELKAMSELPAEEQRENAAQLKAGEITSVWQAIANTAKNQNRRPGSLESSRRPVTFKAAFARLAHALQRAKELFTGTILGDKFDICNSIVDTSPSEWTWEHLDEIRQAADMFDELSRAAPINATKLRLAADRIERILNNRQEKHAVAEDEDERRQMSGSRTSSRTLPDSTSTKRKAQEPC